MNLENIRNIIHKNQEEFNDWYESSKFDNDQRRSTLFGFQPIFITTQRKSLGWNETDVIFGIENHDYHYMITRFDDSWSENCFDPDSLVEVELISTPTWMPI